MFSLGIFYLKLSQNVSNVNYVNIYLNVKFIQTVSGMGTLFILQMHQRIQSPKLSRYLYGRLRSYMLQFRYILNNHSEHTDLRLKSTEEYYKMELIYF